MGTHGNARNGEKPCRRLGQQMEETEKAVEQMGHRSPTMLYCHYRKLIGKEQAQAFFEIFPMGDAEGHSGEPA